MLAILARLVLVEERNHLPHHHLRRVLAQFLRDRDEPDASLCQLADIHLQSERIAEEARVGVHDDDVERAVIIAGPLDHPLELGTIVISGGRTGFDITRGQFPASGEAEGFDLPGLVRDRQISFRLAACAYAVVPTTAQTGAF
ncbi:hypothetical protein ASE61_19725 [Bosea sp. Root670]|nr:hypothetical protein ASE61_19725 [Bosea sp. Root670]